METHEKRPERRKLRPVHIWMIVGAVLALAAMVVVLISETFA